MLCDQPSVYKTMNTKCVFCTRWTCSGLVFWPTSTVNFQYSSLYFGVSLKTKALVFSFFMWNGSFLQQDISLLDGKNYGYKRWFADSDASMPWFFICYKIYCASAWEMAYRYYIFTGWPRLQNICQALEMLPACGICNIYNLKQRGSLVYQIWHIICHSMLLHNIPKIWDSSMSSFTFSCAHRTFTYNLQSSSAS
jgi:hypothetical protein